MERNSEYTAVTGPGIPDAALALLRDLFDTAVLPADPRLPVSVSDHADLSVAFPDGAAVVREDHYFGAAKETVDALCRATGRKLLLEPRRAEDVYPHDTGLCARFCGRSLICRTASTSGVLLDEAAASGYGIIDVNQGYSACSVIALSDGSAVTSDRGIFAALSSRGISCLLIRPGYISLPPYDRDHDGGLGGFPGGASGLCGDILYTVGDFSLHPDCRRFFDFCGEHGTRVRPLCGGVPTDIGGIFFLKKAADA